MKHTSLFSGIAVLISALMLNVSPVFADTSTPYTYGGNPVPENLLINKLVKNPISNLFVDNLGSTDPTFSPGSNVTFRLVVKNASGETMHPVTVVDQLPSYLTFISANVPSTYDKGLNKVIMTLDNVIAGETRTIEIVAQVAAAAAFPTDRSMFCLTNYGKVTAPSRPGGNEDRAQLCVTAGKGNLPVAGVNDVITLLPFMALGGIGTVLLKKTK